MQNFGEHGKDDEACNHHSEQAVRGDGREQRCVPAVELVDVELFEVVRAWNRLDFETYFASRRTVCHSDLCDAFLSDRVTRNFLSDSNRTEF